MSHHPVNPRQPKAGNRDGVQYDLGYYAGRAAGGGGKPPSGCRRGLLALPLRLLLLPVTVLLAKRDQSGPLGGRGDDPKHKDGDWTYDRDRGGHTERKHTKDIPDDEVDGEQLGKTR